MKRLTIAATLFVFCLFAAGAALAAELVASDKPINVDADSLEVDNKNNVAHFIGKVTAKQGDVNIVCDQLDVYYDNTDKPRQEAPAQASGESALGLGGGDGRVTKVVALGHVRVTQKDRVAVGRKGTYWAGARKLLMEGNATVWQGKNQVAGEKITVFLDQDRALVHGQPGKRVSVTIVPDKKK
ncbi:lipopolysaccharide transport periplasmic protein LptA [Desulfarculus baarsii DSM 2075]|uniref:Lipopolysaccharide transport periplasmic protein LptA n=1 Tax=Desulfarculus baarsii (strain ATCC 33931 / DSM 2075 / LMG 7858 / VKM B-1802 / 2st14) TaxID=644282 RepID=E1QL59_DESB2|nr:lipopolysaccharide transport periplasmic protein LptA [Desulfarculus baarsii]ADK85324.1 lipopolysaccharide transport periplasmic protein LptA [Desulfarculus baarsii DSM 2075]